MKIELNNNNRTITIADLKPGDTFLHRSTEDSDTDSVFIVTYEDGAWPYLAVDLASGKEISLEEDEVVIPIKVKIVPDT